MPARPPIQLPEARPPIGYIQIGPYELGPGAEGPAARCTVEVTYKSAGKVDEHEAQGTDDAKTVWGGRKPCDLDITVTWNRRDGDADLAIEEVLAQLSPRGPNPGKSWAFGHARARIHAADVIMVKDLSGPADKPGTFQTSAKLSAATVSPKAQKRQTGPGDAFVDIGVGGFDANDNPFSPRVSDDYPLFPTTPSGGKGPTVLP